MESLQARIEKAHQVTSSIFNSIQDDQWTSPTPCTDWDVRQLANHLVGGYRLFYAAIQGTGQPMDFDSDWLGTDPFTEYKDASTDVISVWKEPGVLERTMTISVGPVPGHLAALIHLTEVTVHGIDLAVATSQEQSIDEAAAENLLETMQLMGVMEQFRVPGVFEPERNTAAEAAPHKRLMAFLGRPAGFSPVAQP